MLLKQIKKIIEQLKSEYNSLEKNTIIKKIKKKLKLETKVCYKLKLDLSNYGRWYKMNAKLKSKTISNYYTSNPDNYILSFHHYNIVVDNDSKEEYYLLEKDIEFLREYNKENSILYFSDIYNLKKIKKST